MRRRTPGRSLAAIVLVALFAVGLGACGGDDEPTAEPTTTTEPEEQGSDVIQIDYLDYSYEVSGPLNAGGTIEISNVGKEFHMMRVVKLKRGKTLADLQEIVDQQFSEEGAGGEEDGASTTAAPGRRTTTTAGGEEDGTSTTAAPGRRTTTTTGDEEVTSTTGVEGGGQEEDPLAEVADEISLPGNFMSPGAEAAITLPDLAPGTYAIMCLIQTEGEGTLHAAKGMVDQFKVVEGDAPAAPTADATYKVAPGEAVEGPATLTPGEHTLRIEGVGDAGPLEPGLFKLNPGTTLTQFDKVLTDLFEGDDPPPKGAAARVPGQVVFGGFDLEDTPFYYLTVNLEAGTYYLTGADNDDEDASTAAPTEMIRIRVA